MEDMGANKNDFLERSVVVFIIHINGLLSNNGLVYFS